MLPWFPYVYVHPMSWQLKEEMLLFILGVAHPQPLFRHRGDYFLC